MPRERPQWAVRIGRNRAIHDTDSPLVRPRAPPLPDRITAKSKPPHRVSPRGQVLRTVTGTAESRCESPSLACEQHQPWKVAAHDADNRRPRRFAPSRIKYLGPLDYEQKNQRV